MGSDSDEPDIDPDEFWAELPEGAPQEPDSPFKTEADFIRSRTIFNERNSFRFQNFT